MPTILRNALFFFWAIPVGLAAADPLACLAAESFKAIRECLVCGKTTGSEDFVVHYKGVEFPLCSAACLGAFEKAKQAGTLDSITGKIEPRAALFHAGSETASFHRDRYIWAGLYVLAGFLCGGLASFVAIQKGLAGRSAFAWGFLLNIAGLVLVWRKEGQAMMFSSPGLAKVPTTRAPSRCPACGLPAHPAARSCPGCRTPLSPTVPSEVERAR